MNKILLSKNKYAILSLGTTNKHSEQQYRLFTNRVKLKQNKYVNTLIAFINIFNSFVTEKFPKEKELWLIVNDNQTTNLNLLDAKDKIIDFNIIIKELENRLVQLEKLMQPVTGANINYTSIRLEKTITHNNKRSSYISAGNLNWDTLADNKTTNPLVYIATKQVRLKYTFSSRIVNAHSSYVSGWGNIYFDALNGNTTVDIILSI